MIFWGYGRGVTFMVQERCAVANCCSLAGTGYTVCIFLPVRSLQGSLAEVYNKRHMAGLGSKAKQRDTMCGG